MPESDVSGRWAVSLLRRASVETGGARPVSTFYIEAALIVASAEMVDQTFTYQCTGVWRKVVLQILAGSGWRPDCTRQEHPNVARAVPPPVRISVPIAIGELDTLRLYSDALEDSPDGLPEKAARVLRVEASRPARKGAD